MARRGRGSLDRPAPPQYDGLVDGIHDLGGLEGFGPVPRGGAHEECFHADWQRRVLGMCLLARPGNIDMFRHAIERIDPVTYLTAGYFGRWLGALETLIEEAGSLPPAGPTLARREIDTPPAFAIGDRVRARELHTPGHTRLPGYARGRTGTVALVQGAWVFPDTHAHGQGEHPQTVYAVSFDGRELWGESAEEGLRVTVDLFESYLEPATP